MLGILKSRFLFLIVIFAAGLRIFYITKVPPSLNWDEVSHGYNAYSILKTGRDEWGVKFPLIFRAYGDYKLPVYIYLTTLSEAVLGVNSLAVRLPGVLAGIGTVIVVYFLAWELFKKRSIALTASLLTWIEPWSLFLSRAAFEANLALFLFVTGAYFFLKSRKNLFFLILSSVFLGLSVWTYNSFRIFTPLMLLALYLIYRRFVISHFLLVALFLVPMFFQLFSLSGQARYSRVTILDEGAINKILETRASIKAPDPIPRFMANKITYFVKEFAKNYVAHFSANFLFFKGGSHYQFSLPGRGLIYLINLPFFLIGLICLIKQKSSSSRLLLTWLLLAPIASSLTREAPHALRAITFLPVPMIISAYGLSKITSLKPLLIIYLIVLFISLENYFIFYFADYRRNYSWAWQYGYQQVVDYAKENYFKYDKIIVTKKYGEPHEFFLFYWPWDPAKYQNDPNLIRFYQSNWWWVDRFDKFYFVNDWQVKDLKLESGGNIDCLRSRCLLITSPDNFPFGWSKIKTINFLDGRPAFEMYEN